MQQVGNQLQLEQPACHRLGLAEAAAVERAGEIVNSGVLPAARPHAASVSGASRGLLTRAAPPGRGRVLAHLVGAQRLVGRRCERLARAQAEMRAVPRADDLAGFHFGALPSGSPSCVQRSSTAYSSAPQRTTTTGTPSTSADRGTPSPTARCADVDPLELITVRFRTSRSAGARPRTSCSGSRADRMSAATRASRTVGIRSTCRARPPPAPRPCRSRARSG